MKLIHLPTGEVYEAKVQPYNLLNKYPDNYIRLTIPELWRVEGYDKSLEWAKYQPAYDPSEHKWDFVTNKKGRNVFDKEIFDVTFMQLHQISRAEFEYHIYNPWKAMQASEFKISRETQAPWAVDPTDGMFKPVRDFNDPTEQSGITEADKLKAKGYCFKPQWDFNNPTEQLDMRDVDKTFSPSPLYKHMAENHNVTLLGSEENDIKQIILNDVDTLKQQAEKMGYELVKKEVRWEGDNFKFDLSQESLMITALPRSFRPEIKITLTQHELDTLIEKYNQFKSNP